MCCRPSAGGLEPEPGFTRFPPRRAVPQFRASVQVKRCQVVGGAALSQGTGLCGGVCVLHRQM